VSYQEYADHHVTARTEPLPDWCHNMLRPKAECSCQQCRDSNYPDDGVESDGGEIE
jgi:hypothetical protein